MQALLLPYPVFIYINFGTTEFWLSHPTSCRHPSHPACNLTPHAIPLLAPTSCTAGQTPSSSLSRSNTVLQLSSSAHPLALQRPSLLALSTGFCTELLREESRNVDKQKGRQNEAVMLLLVYLLIVYSFVCFVTQSENVYFLL